MQGSPSHVEQRSSARWHVCVHAKGRCGTHRSLICVVFKPECILLISSYASFSCFHFRHNRGVQEAGGRENSILKWTLGFEARLFVSLCFSGSRLSEIMCAGDKIFPIFKKKTV